MTYLRQLLHILILSLSLSTLFITFLTYLIYKIRQLPKTGREENQVPLDGTYFRRFAPHLQTIPATDDYERVAKKIAVEKSWRNQVMTSGAPVFFVLLTGVIFCSLFFEENIEVWMKHRAELAKSENYEKLLDQGLLKKFDFNPFASKTEIKEEITDGQKKQLAQTLSEFRGRRITLVSTPRALKFNSDVHTKALQAWETWFKGQHISYKVSMNLESLGEGGLIILPQITCLSQAEKVILSKWVESGSSLLASGPIGICDGTGEASPSDFAEKQFGVTFAKSLDQETSFPSVFAGGKAPLWNSSAGLMLNWFPLDSQVKATASAQAQELSSAFESNFQGRFRTTEGQPSVRIQMKIGKSGGRTLWTALDPVRDETWTDADSFHQNLILSSLLQWGFNESSVHLSPLPNAAQKAVALSLEARDSATGAERIVKTLREAQWPVTIFTTTEFFQKSKKMQMQIQEGVEFAILSSGKDAGKDPTLESEYARIEASRLALEEITGQPVRGLRVVDTNLTSMSLNAALQNHLSYSYGILGSNRLSPIALSQGGMNEIPRPTQEDLALLGDRLTSTSSKRVGSMKTELNRVSQLGGVYVLSLHANGFGEAENIESLKQFVSEVQPLVGWSVGLADWNTWSQDLRKVEVSTVRGGSGKMVSFKVKNGSAHELRGLTLNLDQVPGLTSQSEKNWSLKNASGPQSQLVIESIQAGQAITFETKSTLELRQPAQERAGR